MFFNLNHWVLYFAIRARMTPMSENEEKKEEIIRIIIRQIKTG
jgi:hypothetical protein